jgi:hypothetical protein
LATALANNFSFKLLQKRLIISHPKLNFLQKFYICSISMNKLLLLCVLISSNCFSQDSTFVKKKNIIWYGPSDATEINGLLFTFWPIEKAKLPVINGAEINLCPVAIFFAPMLLINTVLDKETSKPPIEEVIDFKNFKKVNGLQIGFGNLDKTIINGIDINLSGSFDSKVNGITISGVLNKHQVINGLTVGVMGNHDKNCKGVQIGLFNLYRNLKGFQFGLWNKNQKRKLPFINFAFKE